MLAEGYFWSADQGFGHETQAPVQRRRGDGRVRGRAGGDGDGDGDVGGGDYHVLQLLRASLSLTHTLSFSLSSPLSVSLSVRVRNKSSTTHQKPCFNLARAIASLDDIMLTSPLGQYKGREGADSRKNTKSAES